MVWRRLLVSSETSLAQLHAYFQVAFDWSDEHLHRFRIQGKDDGIANRGGISFDDNPQCYSVAPHDAEAEQRTGSGGDRFDGSEGLRGPRVAGRKARGTRSPHVAQTASGRQF